MMRRLASAALAATVIMLAAPILAAVPNGSWAAVPNGSWAASSKQVPTNEQEPTSEPVVIADGHADLGPRIVDGVWRVQLRDDTADPTQWRDLSGVVVRAGDASRVTVPEDQRFAFLGTPGSTVWLMPQVQQPGVVWLGWNTQDPPVAAGVRREVIWRLHGVDGPGRFVLFLNGAFGDPQPVFDSGEQLPQQSAIEANTHVHGNWVFTEPGEYRLEVEMSAVGNDGAPVTDRQILRIHAGDGPIAQVASVGLSPLPTVLASEPASEPAPEPVARVLRISNGQYVALAVAAAGILAAAWIVIARRRASASADRMQGVGGSQSAIGSQGADRMQSTDGSQGDDGSQGGDRPGSADPSPDADRTRGSDDDGR